MCLFVCDNVGIETTIGSMRNSSQQILSLEFINGKRKLLTCMSVVIVGCQC